ncbi:MAG: PEP-CTERM sorting domain-containing protein [Pirellulales bacterium]|nr:PEP-CTERM sorting domain-containing protein [Pirellulales bacterium]
MRLVLAVFASLIPALVHADILAQFNFNTLDNDASTGTLSASAGGGTFSTVGGATTFFGFGTGSSDPELGANDSALGLGGFPAQGTASGTVGFQVSRSTVGFGNLVLKLDQKNQPSSNKFYEVQVRTALAGPFLPLDTYGIAAADVWENAKTFSLAVPAAANNPDFAVRVVAVFEPGGSQYVASEAGYNGQISTLLDMVTLEGAIVPEPSTVTLIAMAVAATLCRRRRQT